MDYSGERFIPGLVDPFDEIAVEHLQRYQSLTDLVRGKCVLDAGSGEGYGANIMAATAAHVVGVEISPEAVENARATYRLPNLEFRTGSIDNLPFSDHSFDVVVSFEVIEHLEELLQAAFLREARRVLRKAGILVISTPNKAVYTDSTGHHNRFHKKEFYVEEFESFLRQVFPRVLLFDQGWFVSSVLQRPSSPSFQSLRALNQSTLPPKYVIAVCGVDESLEAINLSSILLDPKGKLEALSRRILELQKEVVDRNAWVFALEEQSRRTGQRIAELQQEVDERNTWASTLEEQNRSIEQRIVELQQEVDEKNSWAVSLQSEVQNLGKAVKHYQQESAEFQAHIASLDQHIAHLGRAIDALNEEIKSQQNIIGDREAELESIKQSNFWKLATRYWILRDSHLPNGSRRRRVVKSMVRLLMKALHSQPSATPESPPSPGLKPPAARAEAAVEAPVLKTEAIEFTQADHPKVSIIVPCYNQWDSTYRCMKSIRQTMAGLACEIILADDGSTDPTVQAGDILISAKILRDGENRGFLRNCNRAAALAAGKYIYFLNNDTELRAGAIQELASVLDRDANVGIAGSKLIYPDGRLQEAGGIIWQDGSGWNYGRGEDPAHPAFNYLKEVDYVSGASLMIRGNLWKEIGGFDDRYAPAYCEDSDLAFEARKRGFKVIYQPQSVVVHHEGSSHGTDVAQNTKAFQLRNQEILRNKWAAELARHPANGTHVFRARDRSTGRKTILIIDHYVPHFDRDAGSRTIWAFIEAFLAIGMNVKFIGDNFSPHQPYTDILQQAGVEVLAGPWFADNWPEWLAENSAYVDYVFLNRPHIAPKYLNAVRTSTKARVLYYVHDLHYMRELQWAVLKNDQSLKMRAEQTKAKEKELMSRMDTIFSCSDTEADMIRELCPGVDVIHVPPYSIDVDCEWEFDAQARTGLLFVGGFSHPPNADAVLWFVGEIWPAVKAQLPGAVLSIAGSAPPPEVLALASNDVKILGFVSENRLGELYRTTRLAVVPLRYGAGVKGKTVEAMAHGVPVVCTPWGVEGMAGVEEILDPLQYLVPLGEGIVKLYGDLPRLKEISRRERAFVARHFTIEKIKDAFTKALAPGA